MAENKTKIDIFSGFLGAGKTTLIKKLIQECFAGERIVLIENEFGEIGIDGGFMREAGIQVNELNSGCICCSLVGDFREALKKVVETYHPDRILIEPSGVGKLSDVTRAVEGVAETLPVQLNSFVTVADVNKVKLYMKNFGEFYNDQVSHASRSARLCTGKRQREEDRRRRRPAGRKEPHRHQSSPPTGPCSPAPRSSRSWTASGIWWPNCWPRPAPPTRPTPGRTSTITTTITMTGEEHEHGCCHHHHDEEEHEHECCHHHHDEEEHEHECCHHHHDEEEHEHECCHHHHDEEEHEHECCHHHHDEDGHHHEHHYDEHGVCSCGHHHHDHDADEVFTSWGRETAHKYSRAALEEALTALDGGSCGMILRAKGIVDGGAEGWLEFDMVPGEHEIRPSTPRRDRQAVRHRLPAEGSGDRRAVPRLSAGISRKEPEVWQDRSRSTCLWASWRAARPSSSRRPWRTPSSIPATRRCCWSARRARRNTTPTASPSAASMWPSWRIKAN